MTDYGEFYIIATVSIACEKSYKCSKKGLAKSGTLVIIKAYLGVIEGWLNQRISP
jgi:hypothetical protein